MRAANQGKIGVDIVNWRHDLDQKWTKLRFSEVKVETESQQHIFEVQVHLDGLEPEAVRVELFANGIDGAEPERLEMKNVRQQVGTTNSYAYRAEAPATRPATDYTARLVPHHDSVAVPLEASYILWQR